MGASVLELDPTVSVTQNALRASLMLNGRASTPSPLRRLTLDHAGQTLLELVFPEGTVPDLPGPFSYGLTAMIFVPGSSDARLVTLEATLTLADGSSDATRFIVALNDQPQHTAAVIDGATRPVAEYAALLPQLALNAEHIAVSVDGALDVSGWAISLTPLRSVIIHAGATAIGAAHIGLPREDLEAAFPYHQGERSGGFVLQASAGCVPAGTAALRVEATTESGIRASARIPLRAAAVVAPAPPIPEQIRLMCDAATLSPAGHLVVSGWSFTPSGLPRVTIEAEGVILGEAQGGLPRPDVGRAFPNDEPARRSGFICKLDLPPGLPPPAQVTLRAELQDGVAQSLLADVFLHAEEPEAAAVEAPEATRLHIDRPSVADGRVAEPIAGRLLIEGWALGPRKLRSITVLCDDAPIGEAYLGLPRQDVAAAYPEHADALRSGFAFHCPPRAIKPGPHTITLRLHTGAAQTETQSFRIQVGKRAEDKRFIPLETRDATREAALMALLARRLPVPLAVPSAVTVLIRGIGAQTEPAALAATLRSLAGQIGITPRVLLPAAEKLPALRQALALLDPAEAASMVITDSRKLAKMAVAPDALAGILAAGDRLGLDALAELALREADFAYSDERRIDPDGERAPFFKPDWSPELLESCNYIGRFWLARGRTLAAAGLGIADLATHAEYDLVLRLTEAAATIEHAPMLLCERRAPHLDSKEQERAALRSMMERRHLQGRLLDGPVARSWRIVPPNRAQGLVSIIIPTCAAQGHVRACLQSIRDKTLYRDFEIIAIDNIPSSRRPWKKWLAGTADQVLTMREKFNWSRFNNHAAARARGQYLLFLNDDTEVTDGTWLHTLLAAVARPGVAVAGARLLYPGGRVQHAGMFLAGPGQARHGFRFQDSDDAGYFGLARIERNVIAVTGACMLVRREAFEALGGFDETHDVINNDLDFCLRVHAAGQRIVFTPHASLTHHEQASRDGMEESYDTSAFAARWSARFTAGDPYHNPNLTVASDAIAPEDEPLQVLRGAAVRLRHEEVRRILAVKIDHIGDFMTALPALRLLKRRFPRATLTVLIASASRAMAELEPAIDAILTFDYFHARSVLGKRRMSKDEFAALRDRLHRQRFDIAIDLRKHLDARDVLQASGARLLAGFDHQGQFPWLDVALEWEGDRGMQPKRAHVSEALRQLVEATVLATESDDNTLDVAALWNTDLTTVFTPALRRLFLQPVLCLHPGVGNPNRKWPTAHFVALAQAMIDQDGLHVVVIGGPDEAEAAAAVVTAVNRPQAILSAAGTIPLRLLPAFIARCHLYIGNNSGPKHIAAATGVPTIGVHSGVVDAAEWAPIGANAIALQRAMSCAPCYLSKPEDCPRAFACVTGITPGMVQMQARRLLASAGERAPLTRLMRPEPRVEEAPVIERSAPIVSHSRTE